MGSDIGYFKMFDGLDCEDLQYFDLSDFIKEVIKIVTIIFKVKKLYINVIFKGSRSL